MRERKPTKKKELGKKAYCESRALLYMYLCAVSNIPISLPPSPLPTPVFFNTTPQKKILKFLSLCHCRMWSVYLGNK